MKVYSYHEWNYCFSSQNIVQISISLSSCAWKCSICIHESRAHETFYESIVIWHSYILGYPPTDGSRYRQFSHNILCENLWWYVMVVALGTFWMSFAILCFHSEEIWNFVQRHCLNFIAIFWKYKIQPLFLGKFLRLGVPREIVSRATLGTRAIGSPTLIYIHIYIYIYILYAKRIRL